MAAKIRRRRSPAARAPQGETQEEVNSHLKKVLRGAEVVRGGGAAVEQGWRQWELSSNELQ